MGIIWPDDSGRAPTPTGELERAKEHTYENGSLHAQGFTGRFTEALLTLNEGGLD